MHHDDPRWLEYLDIITAWGEASALNRTPPPTDDELWDAARPRRDLQLPEQADPDLLTQLRAAVDAGRGPTPIDLDAVAAAVTARGVPVQVLNSAGGTATLYTGPQTLDPSGDIRFTTSAGPGWFDGPDDTRPMADRTEFGIGPHDGSWDVTAPADATTDQLAELIVAVHAHADAPAPPPDQPQRHKGNPMRHVAAPTHVGPDQWPVLSAVRITTAGDPAEFVVLVDGGEGIPTNRYATMRFFNWLDRTKTTDGEYNLAFAQARHRLADRAGLLAATSIAVEVVVVRDPDYANDDTIFVDGQPYTG